MKPCLITVLLVCGACSASFGTSSELIGTKAEGGDAEFQFTLGTIYAGVAKDEAEACKWYRKAAEQGHVVAQCRLGDMYLRGQGVEGDEGEAARWYYKAAEKGHVGADFVVRMLEDSHRRPYPAASPAFADETKDEKVKGLIAQLQDVDAAKREQAADELGRLGPQAKAAVPTVARQLEDRNQRVRISAATALSRFGAEAKSVVPQLIEALKDCDAFVAPAAASALGHIGPEAKAAVPALVLALKSEEPATRSCSAFALGRIGPDAKAAVPALEEALKDTDTSVGYSAAEALANLSAVSPLIEALKNGTSRERHFAAFGLGCIGPGAKAAVPALTDALNDKDESVRYAAVVALKKIRADK